MAHAQPPTADENVLPDLSQISGQAELERLAFKSLPRAALDAGQILLVQLRRDKTAETGYRLAYRLSFSEPYFAISHSWADRTGNGSSIVIHDLAPWPLCLSPAKLAFLDWLFSIQESAITNPDLGWTSWYWLDLFCIDQTKGDEHLFSRQLKQIPQVFSDAVGCLALLASWPCDVATAMPQSDAEGPDEEVADYDAVDEWLKSHTKVCFCVPFVDAWLTRVWTRQELLYSKRLRLVTANIWLSRAGNISTDCWKDKPQFYVPPLASEGLKEFSSCLIVWATMYRLPVSHYKPAILASMARALIRGDIVDETIVQDQASEHLRQTTLSEWFAFNWSMLLNGSIRFTSHARDAIISQMLHLRGYQVPPSPRSMSLEALAADANSQFRGLLQQYQLVATLMLLDSDKGKRRIGSPVVAVSIENGGLSDILHSVGSPAVLPRHLEVATVEESIDPGLMAYQLECDPRYLVLNEIDIEGRLMQAAHHFIGLQQVWAEAADCRTSWNVRDCLEEIKILVTDFEERIYQPSDILNLKRAVKHCLGRMTYNHAFNITTILSRKSTQYSRPYSAAEVDPMEFPSTFVVRISYQNNAIAPHMNVLFGDLAVGQEGSIWGLGVDLGTKLEHGAAVEVGDDGRPSLVASGALMPTGQGPHYKRIVKGSELPKELITLAERSS